MMELDFVQDSPEEKNDRHQTELTGWETIVFEVDDEKVEESG
jgi:hypothetical protein